MSEQKIINKELLDQLLSEVDELIVSDEIKLAIKDHTKALYIMRLREEAGLDNLPYSYNILFTGNWCYTQSSVAVLIAKIYCALGVCEKAEIFDFDRSDLVSPYIGHTAMKTKEACEKAAGGLFVVYDAHTLFQNGESDMGVEAINMILIEMERNRDKLIVIISGAKNEMQNIMDNSPGLASKFKITIDFADHNG